MCWWREYRIIALSMINNNTDDNNYNDNKNNKNAQVKQKRIDNYHAHFLFKIFIFATIIQLITP